MLISRAMDVISELDESLNPEKAANWPRTSTSSYFYCNTTRACCGPPGNEARRRSTRSSASSIPCATPSAASRTPRPSRRRPGRARPRPGAPGPAPCARGPGRGAPRPGPSPRANLRPRPCCAGAQGRHARHLRPLAPGGERAPAMSAPRTVLHVCGAWAWAARKRPCNCWPPPWTPRATAPWSTLCRRPAPGAAHGPGHPGAHRAGPVAHRRAHRAGHHPPAPRRLARAAPAAQRDPGRGCGGGSKPTSSAATTPSPQAAVIDRHLFVSSFCLRRYGAVHGVDVSGPRHRVLYNPVDTAAFAACPGPTPGAPPWPGACRARTPANGRPWPWTSCRTCSRTCPGRNTASSAAPRRPGSGSPPTAWTRTCASWSP